MKKIIAFLFLVSAMCISAFAQPLISEFNKAKELKLLESTREDVKRILADYEHDTDEDEDYKQYFSTKNAEVKITLASGDCSDGSEYWNVPKWTVTKIQITLENAINLKDFNFDFSSYKKEIEDEESPETFNYHDKDAGILFAVNENEIEEVIIYPTKSKINFLCDNESTSELISGEKDFFDIIYDPIICGPMPGVENLILNKNEIIRCKKSAKNKKCFDNDMKISVTAQTFDSEIDQLVYGYTVSGGKIVGSGKQVTWDLTDVQPGIYTITAGVDDGCGFCGKTKTEEVVVK